MVEQQFEYSRELNGLNPTHIKVREDIYLKYLENEYSFKNQLNRIQAISVFAVRVTPIFTNKKHAINTLKIAPLLRSNVMQS
jgi:hypothetical protein